MSQEKEQVRQSALELLKTHLATGSQEALDEFNKNMASLAADNDFGTMLPIFEEAISIFPDKPQPYYWAARLCKHWSEKLAGDYFDSKQVLGMELSEWMSGKGTPYQEFLELRRKAADYLQKVLELSPDLPEETRDAIEEDICFLRWS